jgi:hypothetical protein
MFKNRKLILMEGEPGAGGGAGAGSGGTALTNGGGASGASGGAAAGAAPNPPASGAPAGAGDAGAGSGGAATDWRSTLSEGLRADATLGKYKSVDELANAYINAQKHISAEKITIPNKNWGDKEWSDFRAKIGVPKEIDKYDVKFKDGSQVAPEFVKSFKEAAHKTGILPQDAQKLADWFVDLDKQATEKSDNEHKSKVQAGLKALDKEWGDTSKVQWARAGKVLKELGDADLTKALNETGAGDNPAVIKFFAKLGETLWKEDVVIGDAGPTHGFTPSQAKAEQSKIMGDMKHPYWVKDHPGHKDAVAMVQQLIQAQAVKN